MIKPGDIVAYKGYNPNKYKEWYYVHDLTIGKFYEAQSIKRGMGFYVWIIDDKGQESGYDMDIFMSVAEWRDKQIDSILQN